MVWLTQCKAFPFKNNSKIVLRKVMKINTGESVQFLKISSIRCRKIHVLEICLVFRWLIGFHSNFKRMNTEDLASFHYKLLWSFQFIIFTSKYQIKLHFSKSCQNLKQSWYFFPPIPRLFEQIVPPIHQFFSLLYKKRHKFVSFRTKKH